MKYDVKKIRKNKRKHEIKSSTICKKNNKNVWNTVVWTTALYNFKTKRFQCDYLEYNAENGRVSKIYFSEL